MSNTVIKVENLSKLYNLGVIGSGTLYRDIQSWWAKIRGKEDPNSKFGSNETFKFDGERAFWALDNVSFNIEQGDIVGIIGRNGAGKSTLLKILSRVTGPTSGMVKIKGRVASLLEVGTGFHPELTGRENIYLNGTILGMRKQEIAKKIDEIIAFAEIEKFVDTPVKRYSSGMYVRLAFAVAAHLDPEILIVDEVLAVGDAAFQKKCLGKMQEVGKQGRTVLFVSHNMPMISSLCSKGIVLQKGKIEFFGNVNQAIWQYYAGENAEVANIVFIGKDRPGNDIANLVEAKIKDKFNVCKSIYDIEEEVQIEITYEVLQENISLNPGVHIFNTEGIRVFTSSDSVIDCNGEFKNKRGMYKSTCCIPGNLLNTGTYYITCALATLETGENHFWEKDILHFQVTEDIYVSKTRGKYAGEFPGVFRPILKWKLEKTEES